MISIGFSTVSEQDLLFPLQDLLRRFGKFMISIGFSLFWSKISLGDIAFVDFFTLFHGFRGKISFSTIHFAMN